jgi:hypothetical protein
VFEEAAFFQKTKIRLQAGKATVDAAGALASLHLSHDPRPDVQMPYLIDRGKALLLNTVSDKTRQITAISPQRMRGKTAFERQVSEKRLFVKHDAKMLIF